MTIVAGFSFGFSLINIVLALTGSHSQVTETMGWFAAAAWSFVVIWHAR